MMETWAFMAKTHLSSVTVLLHSQFVQRHAVHSCLDGFRVYSGASVITVTESHIYVESIQKKYKSILNQLD